MISVFKKTTPWSSQRVSALDPRGPLPSAGAALLTFWVVRQGQEADAGGARARAEDGDSLGVSTEGPDVLLDPA